MESKVSLETGLGQQLSIVMISSRDDQPRLLIGMNSILKVSNARLKLLLFVLVFISAIALFVVDSKLRQLSEKRTRYFQSLAFSAAESESEISSFEELKSLSFVASNLDVYEKLYLSWPFNTPTILVFERDGYVFITEDADYPQSLLKNGKITQKLKKIKIRP